MAVDGWAITSGQYQRNTGGRLPEWYLKQPPQYRGDEFFLLGYSCLETERFYSGAGVGPIPWSKAWEYAYRQGLDRRMCSYFALVILMLDGFYREDLRDEHAKADKADAKAAARAEREAEAKLGSSKPMRKRITAQG